MSDIVYEIEAKNSALQRKLDTCRQLLSAIHLAADSATLEQTSQRVAIRILAREALSVIGEENDQLD